MLTYTNQKVVRIRSAPHDKEHIYGILNIEAMRIASKELRNGNAFRLYVALAMNQNDHLIALSPKALQQEIGLSEKRYRAAVEELTEKGFIVLRHDDSNQYNFYELRPKPTPLPFDASLWGTTSTPKGVQAPPQKGTTSAPKRVQALPSEGEEILHNSTNNTGITQDSSGSFNIYNNYPEGENDIDSEVHTPFSSGCSSVSTYVENENKRVAENLSLLVRREELEQQRRLDAARLNYYVVNRPIDNLRRTLHPIKQALISKVFEKYDRIHPRTANRLRCLERKYGRWIAGWDNACNEPIIAYSIGNTPVDIIKDKIELVPLEWLHDGALPSVQSEPKVHQDELPEQFGVTDDDGDLPF